ncbi:MAG: HlyC/CorC family transporter [Ktedonobacteraceae bacterium]|nr:HlyC/CorC family transporter [Ktedonobacteraceae bacterium]
MPGFVFEIIIIFVLIIANGLFAAAELAIVSARHGRLQQEIDEGKRKKSAQQALELARNPNNFLATVQVGITLIGTLASAFGGASLSATLARWFRTLPLLAPYADTLALGSVVILITYFSLILGELVPKRLALQAAENVAIRLAPLMTLLAKILRPTVVLLAGSTNLVLRLLGRYNAAEQPVTEEDIVYLTQQAIASGTVEKEEKEFISRVFRFTDRPVSHVMVPRTEIVAVETGTPLPQVLETFLESGYTRIPLYQGSLDNVVGVLYAKDLLRPRSTGEPVDLTNLARPAYFVSEYQHIDDLLTTFRRKGMHLAIVIDEYSQVIGLVTLEDLLEELVGEIRDEYDEPESNAFVQRRDGSWLVDGMVDYREAEEKIGLHLPEEEVQRHDYKTLAGLLLAHLGRIPIVGDVVSIDGFDFEVVDMDGRRIDRVLIKRRQ